MLKWQLLKDPGAWLKLSIIAVFLYLGNQSVVLL